MSDKISSGSYWVLYHPIKDMYYFRNGITFISMMSHFPDTAIKMWNEQSAINQREYLLSRKCYSEVDRTEVMQLEPREVEFELRMK